MSAGALKRLMVEYRQLSQSSAKGSTEDMFVAGPLSEDNFFVWEALMKGPDGTPFEGGILVARLEFPKDYPLNPPKMKFDPPILHPNVYANGEVCISILHSPGEDPMHYESASERWSPVQSVEKILLSVISMLSEPNVESGANMWVPFACQCHDVDALPSDACKLFRTDKAEYERRIRRQVRQQLGL